MRIKCPHCNGKGFSELNSAVNMTCGWCMGQGELDLEIVPTEPQTNEDWLRSMTTEQLAEFMQNYTHDIIFDWKGLNNPFLSPFPFKNVIGNKCTTIDGWVEWLKKTHTFE